MRWLTLAAALLAAWAPRAQPVPDAASAQAAVVAFAEHQRAGDWRAVADVLAPDIVQGLGQFTIDFASRALQSADSLRAGVVPRGFEDDPEVWAARLDSMARVAFVESEETPSPKEAFARVLAGYFVHTPRLMDYLSEMSFRPVGAIVEGDSVAFVVGHLGAPQAGPTGSVPEMVIARWTDGRWTINARDDGGNRLVDVVRRCVRNWTETLGRAAGLDENEGEIVE